jgi:colanic acid/amylovoran biosynthesis glycosyltransferase
MTELRPAHVWDDLAPGHLPHSYGDDGIVFARRLLRNGGQVGARTTVLHEVDAATAVAASVLRRGTRRLTDRWDWSRYLRLVERSAARDDLNVLHGHFGTTGARLTPVAAATGLPLVVSFYGVDASAVLRQPAWRGRYRAMFESASALVVLCDAVRERLVEAGADRSKVLVWNMPAGVERHPFRTRSRSEELRLLIAARFVAKKGYFVLLDAFAQFLATGRRGRLTMIGYGPQADAVRAYAAQLHVLEHCTLIDTALSSDFHATFDAALSDADLFLMPSITADDGDDEGGPALTMVCAQASGLPVACTPFPGAERSLIDGQTGRYCAEGDAASLLAAIVEVADDPDVGARWGTAGSALVGAEFSATGQNAAMLSLYGELLSPTASRPHTR